MLTSERIRELWENYSPTQGIESFARAVEAEVRKEVEALRLQLHEAAKNAFQAMPHDIPLRMKRKICVNAGWSGSAVSRAYTELRAEFTGEPYKANEDLEAAWSENAALRKDAERYRWLRREACMGYPSAEGCSNKDAYLVITGYGYEHRTSLVDEAIDAAKGAEDVKKS